MANGPLVVLVTGASSGFGRMIATDLAKAGHTAYASMLDANDENANVAREMTALSNGSGIDLRPIELDVRSEESVAKAIGTIVGEHGRVDVLVHNAGHMVYGPSEAFTPEQFVEIYDVNVLGTQRVNRAALPHMRGAKSGLLVWISSTSVAGGVPPLLGPYFAAKAAMDALAVCYGKELAPFGIETSIVVPGVFTTGTNHFANAGRPADAIRAREYDAEYPADFSARMQAALEKTVPGDADPSAVGRAVVEIVAADAGERPYRVYVDPADDGAAVALPVIDRVRSQFLARIGYPQLEKPTVRATA